MAALDDAVRRLEAALGALEATLGRRLDLERRRGDLETELQIMEAATADVGRRVHRAIGAVRDVLERADAAPAGE
jgi:hypothetical protein